MLGARKNAEGEKETASSSSPHKDGGEGEKGGERMTTHCQVQVLVHRQPVGGYHGWF